MGGGRRRDRRPARGARESLRRVSELVGAIKSYSYMGQAPEQDVDVHEGLENTLTILAHKFKRKGVAVTRD